MDERVKKIAIGVCCFLGVVVILCFVAWIMINNENSDKDQYSNAIDKLADNGTQATATPKPDKPTATPVPTATPTVAPTATPTVAPTTAPTAVPTAVPTKTPTVAPTAAPKATATPKPTSAPTPTKAVKATQSAVKYGDGANDISVDDVLVTGGHVIMIDPAHQLVADLEEEPVGPGAKETRKKQSWGATGVTTGAAEFAYNLYMAQKLRAVLEAKGYTVIMSRETNDVQMSESERAILANNSGAEIVIHLHTNADDRPNVHGIMAYAPSDANPYLSKTLIKKSTSLSNCLLLGILSNVDCNSYGVITRDNNAALNYSSIPATDVEIGYMSNEEEDVLLQNQAYQNNLIMGLADGVDAYFGY